MARYEIEDFIHEDLEWQNKYAQKEARYRFWEQNHRLPSSDELSQEVLELKINNFLFEEGNSALSI